MSKKSNWASLIRSGEAVLQGLADLHGHLDLRGDRQGDPRGNVAGHGHVPRPSRLPTPRRRRSCSADWNNAVRRQQQGAVRDSPSATIDEVAIVAQDGAYPTPCVWSLPPATHPFDQSIQANWYSMACSFFKTHDMRGIYFWGIWYADGANAVPTTPARPRTGDPAGERRGHQECYTGT